MSERFKIDEAYVDDKFEITKLKNKQKRHKNKYILDTIGNAGRTIELDLETGSLKIKTMGSGEKFI